jgi:hypothetical protein
LKSGAAEVHFPFNPRNGKPRYKNIETITYEGLPSPLPVGFLKKATTGYGFTRELSPILSVLQTALPRIRHVVVSASNNTQILNASTLVFSLASLQDARTRLVTVLDRHKSELRSATTNILSTLLPDQFKSTKAGHRPGELYEFIQTRSFRPSQLSNDDLAAAAALLSSLPSSHSFALSRDARLTKASFDRVLVEDLIRKYRKLLSRTSATRQLEQKWQEFFSENMLFFNFGYVAKFEKELILGDKTLNFPDFTMLTTFGYLDIFEIKTHLTQLLAFDGGRKNFYWASEAAKAISQAENYIDSLVKQEDTVIKNIRDEYQNNSVDAVRPIAYIIASTRDTVAGESTASRYTGKLGKKLWNDFRRLSDSLKNVRFILYDELLAVFETTLSRLSQQVESHSSEARAKRGT